MRLCVVAMAMLALAGCSPASSTSETASSSYAPRSLGVSVGETDEDREFDDDAAREAAKVEVDGEEYTSFDRYGCTDDCSGHEAGFAFARDNDLDADDCTGDSQPFVEGCRTRGEEIEEKVEEAQTSFEDGDDTYKQE